MCVCVFWPPVKDELIEFFDKRAKLFSGTEFSKDHFPKEIYSHDVELIEDVHSLSSRPFPVSGIRLVQLKQDIDDLVKNGVLSPGDSPFTSPIFYVTKKPGEGKTASRGRLCFDYRRKCYRQWSMPPSDQDRSPKSPKQCRRPH